MYRILDEIIRRKKLSEIIFLEKDGRLACLAKTNRILEKTKSCLIVKS